MSGRTDPDLGPAWAPAPRPAPLDRTGSHVVGYLGCPPTTQLALRVLTELPRP